MLPDTTDAARAACDATALGEGGVLGRAAQARCTATRKFVMISVSCTIARLTISYHACARDLGVSERAEKVSERLRRCRLQLLSPLHISPALTTTTVLLLYVVRTVRKRETENWNAPSLTKCAIQ